MKLDSIDAARQLANLPTSRSARQLANPPTPRSGGQLAALDWEPLAAVFF
jgi:hypothetical protein